MFEQQILLSHVLLTLAAECSLPGLGFITGPDGDTLQAFDQQDEGWFRLPPLLLLP
ncbi:MAG: hypothetical protein ABFR65_00855 [Pseudomonadota bacterium]